ncbi:DNA cytosine methyltransferase [uncultured Gimesia sp.]|uniref:DNA cytosine methyltransferase n=1 Tax=uncultured Gimesia sp. TaxID=1678688 RepID=UPI00262D86BE|nr:DNA cytosine methyltransferase [uncultured Gimesia sp.]
MSETPTIPIIDIFAGPGGLGEGFSAYSTSNHHPFRVKLSIEKDAYAHKTLQLRSFFRQFASGKVPDIYYESLKNNSLLKQLPDRLKEESAAHWSKWENATEEALHAELGGTEVTHDTISRKISTALGNKKKPWVLIGGPPCQAYSLAGRVRNKGIKNYRIEDDQRSTLYLEYLRIIAEHRPAIFVMENVKGMLSATHENQKLFQKILADLSHPLASGCPESEYARNFTR